MGTASHVALIVLVVQAASLVSGPCSACVWATAVPRSCNAKQAGSLAPGSCHVHTFSTAGFCSARWKLPLSPPKAVCSGVCLSETTPHKQLGVCWTSTMSCLKTLKEEGLGIHMAHLTPRGYCPLPEIQCLANHCLYDCPLSRYFQVEINWSLLLHFGQKQKLQKDYSSLGNSKYLKWVNFFTTTLYIWLTYPCTSSVTLSSGLYFLGKLRLTHGNSDQHLSIGNSICPIVIL